MLAIAIGSVFLGLSIACRSDFSHSIAYGFPFNAVEIPHFGAPSLDFKPMVGNVLVFVAALLAGSWALRWISSRATARRPTPHAPQSSLRESP
jgi:hypothetical protein